MGTCGSVNQHPKANGNIAFSFVIPRACDFFGMTIFLGHSNPLPKHELSSREPVTFSILSRFLHPTRCFKSPPKRRHPERSASQIHRITEDLWRGVEGPRRCMLADALRSFPATDYKET